MGRNRQVTDSKRRLPKQARARNTVDAILEATARILQQQGTRSLTTNRIAERAGVGISTLYQYFKNKEAILVAVARREIDAHEKDVVNAISVSSITGDELDRVAIHALIDATGKRHRARRIATETLAAQGLSADAAAPVHEVARVLAKNAGQLMPRLKDPLSPVELFVLTRAIQGAVSAGLREEFPQYRSAEFEKAIVHLFRGFIAQLSTAA